MNSRMSAVNYTSIIGFLLIACLNGDLIVHSKRKNILLIIVDDLRPALGCYNDGNAHTPNIDFLSTKSVIFTKTFVQQALCAPSRNSLLTSRRPDSLQLYDFYSYWRQVAGNFTTLPQYFKENGYHTMSIGKVFHPGMSSNGSDDQPYSWSEPPFHPSTEKFKESHVCPNPDGTLGRNLVCPVVVKFQPEQTLPDIQSLIRAKSFLKTSTEKPFFLAVGFHKPHVPLKFPREYLNFHDLEKVTLPAVRWRPYNLPNVAWNPWTDLREREDIAALNLTFPYGPMPDNESRLIRQNYYAAVTYIDDLVGQLLAELNETGKMEDTIILFTGDHGWSMAEHGEWSKYSNFDISLRVPFILHVPGLTNDGFVSNHLIELVDILPTLSSFANLPDIPICPNISNNVSLCTEGISLKPLITHIVSNKFSSMEWKQGAFSQYPRPGPFPTLHPNSDKPRLKQIRIMGYSLRTNRYRYTEWVGFDNQEFQPIWSNLKGTELYDHQLDPEENLNLIDRKEMRYTATRLSQQLRAGWKYSLPKAHISYG